MKKTTLLLGYLSVYTTCFPQAQESELTSIEKLEQRTQSIEEKIEYDWYDTNTKVSENDIGQNGTDKGDVAYNTLGLGLLWKAGHNIRLLAYYEIVSNEKSENAAAFNNDLKTMCSHYAYNLISKKKQQNEYN